jgi:hypothetical protein
MCREQIGFAYGSFGKGERLEMTTEVLLIHWMRVVFSETGTLREEEAMCPLLCRPSP